MRQWSPARPNSVSAAVQTSSPPALLLPPAPTPVVVAGLVTASATPTAAHTAIGSGETAALPAPLPPPTETATPPPRASLDTGARLPPQPAPMIPTLAPVELPAVIASPTLIVQSALAAQEGVIPVDVASLMVVGLVAFGGLPVLGGVALLFFWLLRRNK